MLALADLHDSGNVPAILVSLLRPSQISPLVYKGQLGGGYYDVLPDPEYRDKSEAGKLLQSMIDGNASGMEQHAKKFTEFDLRGTPGFFPTPPELAEQIIEAADIRPGHRVLEPSAGTGNLCRLAIAVVVQSHPEL